MVFALIDCNNFFVSCERIFRPDLRDKPVVVFSSNDGVIVARSNEAKLLGIPMGAPVFKYRDILKQHNVVQFSGNFDLYGDISRRIIELLTTITPRIEVYSIDESFLDLSQLPIKDYAAWGRYVRQAILDWIGVPVSIGIAPTKTLAKLASDHAKLDNRLWTLDDRNTKPNVQRLSSNVHSLGVVNLVKQPQSDTLSILQSTPVEAAWGIGWRLGPKMRAEGIHSAQQLAQLRPQRAQQLMGIKGRQLVAELNGVSCHPLELEHQQPKSIARTRTFGEDTGNLAVLESAIASFATSAAFRLRRSGQLTRRASLFITTNRNKPGYRRWSREITYQAPTADTGRLITDLLSLLGIMHNPGVQYHRAGVLLYDFYPNQLQTDILGRTNVTQHNKSQSRMKAIDHLNERHGKRTIRYATEDLNPTWQPHRHDRSPRYTTHITDLPTAKIK